MPTFRIASKKKCTFGDGKGTNGGSSQSSSTTTISSTTSSKFSLSNLAQTATLKKLTSSTSKSLLSQQSIPSLGMVLKELVENALDAISARKSVQKVVVDNAALGDHHTPKAAQNDHMPGSSTFLPCSTAHTQFHPHIHINLKQFGLTSISLSDNATGIPKESLPSLTHQYHTSKLQSLSDFDKLSTFGFRGVALAAICRASGKFGIITRTAHDATGRHLSYANDSLDMMQHTQHVAREVGTTVIVEDLFRPFPVRRRVLEKSIKKEYQKALKLIQAYALMEHGVKFTLTNEANSGKRQTVFSTRGVGDKGSGLRDSVSRVLGGTQFKKMEEVKIEGGEHLLHTTTAEHEKTKKNESSSDKQNTRTFTLSGYISQPKSNKGRSQNDRQYLYLNRRPVDLPRLSKTLQEVYKQFNAHQVPAFVLNLELDMEQVDINVSTDKRTVFIKNEEEILDIVREKLEQKWTRSVNHFEMAQNSVQLTLLETSQGVGHEEDKGSGSQRSFSTFNTHLQPQPHTTSSQRSILTPLSSRKRKRCTETPHSHAQSNGCCTSPASFKKQRYIVASDETPTTLSPALAEEDEAFQQLKQLVHCQHVSNSYSDKEMEEESIPVSPLDDLISSLEDRSMNYSRNTSQNTQSEMEGYILDNTQEELSMAHRGGYSTPIISSPHSIATLPPLSTTPIPSITESDITSLFHFFADRIQTQNKLCPPPPATPFQTSLTTNSHQECEDELSRVVEKSHFSEMQIVGQFNKGFILVEHHGDLFIVDQHASDEKYNFELLQHITRLNVQPLIAPKQLDVSPEDIALVKGNEDIFKKNGFTFLYSEQMDKLYLKTVPQSKQVTFNEHDFHELLYTIQQCTEMQLTSAERRASMRPSKVRKMFASRACRSSVMVGTTLSRREMTKIVRHLGELDKPWHCPHGRPTMRWLCRLEGGQSGREGLQVEKEEEKRSHSVENKPIRLCE